MKATQLRRLIPNPYSDSSFSSGGAVEAIGCRRRAAIDGRDELAVTSSCQQITDLHWPGSLVRIVDIVQVIGAPRKNWEYLGVEKSVDAGRRFMASDVWLRVPGPEHCGRAGSWFVAQQTVPRQSRCCMRWSDTRYGWVVYPWRHLVHSSSAIVGATPCARLQPMGVVRYRREFLCLLCVSRLFGGRIGYGRMVVASTDVGLPQTTTHRAKQRESHR